MAIETNPSRELSSHREVRKAVGRHTTRTVLLCAASLAVGLGIGQYFLRQQMQVQQGVVEQLQREIRGLTGDIQRQELESSRGLRRFETLIARLERTQQLELSQEYRGTQQRLASLERLVDRQLQSTREGEAACLAEFEAYRRRQLAVPVDLIAAAVARWTAGRTAELGVVREEIRSHAEFEQARLAALEGEWYLGSAAGPRSKDLGLNAPVAGFTAIGPSAMAKSIATPSGDDLIVIQQGDRVRADSVPSGAISVSVARPAAAAAEVEHAATSSMATVIEIVPIPETSLPAPRPLASAVHRRRAFGSLISFASGRVVSPSAPRQTERNASSENETTAAVESPAETILQ